MELDVLQVKVVVSLCWTNWIFHTAGHTSKPKARM
jgi:hypothetical protein